MNILHWNIEAGGYASYASTDKYPKKMNKIVEAIGAIGADFVSLVDVYRWGNVYTVEELKKMFGYSQVFLTELEDKNLPFCRNKLGVLTMTNDHEVKFEKIRAYDRNFIKTTLTTKNIELDIFSIHLNHLGEEIRKKEASALLKYNRSRPTIIVGDFNTIDEADLETTKRITDNPIIKLGTMIKKSRPIIKGMYPATVTKIFKQAGLTDWGEGKGNTYPSFKVPLILNGPAARLDYAFGSKDIKLIKFEVLKHKKYDQLSDHYPILVEIEV